MLRKKEVLTAIGTLGCAIGIGFVMQNTAEAEKRYGVRSQNAPEADFAGFKSSMIKNSTLDVQSIKLTSAEFDHDVPLPVQNEVIELASSAPESVLEFVPKPAISPHACEINAETRPLEAAMVGLTLTAPCLPNEKVTIRHNGMAFTETTSQTGSLNIAVPALTKDAVFVVVFSTGQGAVTSTMVEELTDFDRAVLQWKGNAGFQIHAREFGADYGTEGHRWADAPGDLSAVAAGTSGILTRHGDTTSVEPLLAEVYTFPHKTGSQSGDVVLTVETEVTEANCGLEVEAKSLETTGDGEMRTRSLILPVPSCESVGSFLVLNNLLQDMKVAVK